MLFYFLYRIGQWLALSVPLRMGYGIAVFFARLKFFWAREEVCYVANNLKCIIGKDKKQISIYTKAMYENFGKYVVDFFRSAKLDRGFIDKYIQIENLRYMTEPLAKGTGIIGVSAHIGNWELCAQVLAVLVCKVNAIALTHKNQRINNFFINQRRASGINVIPLGIGIRKCFYALKRNEIVGILGDRDFSGSNGIFIDFLGKKMLIPQGPAVLSLKTGAPIVPTFIIRNEQDDCYFKFVVEEPIYPARTGAKEQDIKMLTEKMAKVIECYVRKYPKQWFVFREFWKAEKVEVL